MLVAKGLRDRFNFGFAGSFGFDGAAIAKSSSSLSTDAMFRNVIGFAATGPFCAGFKESALTTFPADETGGLPTASAEEAGDLVMVPVESTDASRFKAFTALGVGLNLKAPVV